MMILNNQDRQKELEGRKAVILSAAKDLARWAARSFAALRMTLPILMVELHHHAHTKRT
jgi:hypothetical protein